MFEMSSSEISVPIEICTASLSSCSVSSSRIALNSHDTQLVLIPMALTTLAYWTLSVTILPISGKCQPYHSRTRMAYVLSSLSSSSRSPIACTTIVSTLSGENLSLCRPRECASPRRMILRSSSLVPASRVSRFARTPRMISSTDSLYTQGMSRAVLIALPRPVSYTASVSLMSLSTMFFLRNFLRGLLRELSSMAVAATSASLVSSNFLNVLSFIALLADSELAKACWISSTSSSLFSSHLKRA
mmetsp:Transcript_16178/g.39419  ORF Transcript_16178/g.39419 Transcript_16178/m.39419 type:complete len:245 (-) Transcript_16178:216-950(-)